MRAGDVIADRFQVERLAGSGGMGEVYRARDLVSGEPVAVKVLRAFAGAAREPLARRRFAREAQALATLRQEGVVRYLAHGATPDGDMFLAMEWLEGETLGELFARRSLSVREALVVGEAAARALASVHARGFVHRDVKPSNLFLRARDLAHLVLIDFGVVRQGIENPLTRTGSVLGTIGFMSPEQARGLRDVDARADVFSLGCVLYKALSGRSPFTGEDMVSVLLKVAMEEPPPLREIAPHVPADLDAAIGRMLAKAPDERPASGADVAATLAELRLGLGGEEDGGGARGAPSTGRTVSLRPPGGELTGSERRVVCLVLARGLTSAGAPGEPRAGGETTLDGAGAIARRHRGEMSALAGGSLLVTFTSADAATDLAVRAARCALALHELRPEARVAVVSGRSVLPGGSPAGSLLDRAAALSEEEPPAGAASRPSTGAPPSARAARRISPVRIDDATAALLGARFDVIAREGRHELCGERVALEVGCALLGRPVPCVGRETELAMLEAYFARAADEPAAAAVLVTGPPGMGKSRVRDELLRRLRARSGTVTLWTCEGDPMSAGSPFGMLHDALRGAIGIRDGDPAPARRAALLAWVRALLPDAAERVAAFLGEVCGVPFPDDAHPHLPTARRDPQRMLDQIRRAFVDALGAACAAGPLVLVMEDLHWGDLPSIRLVDDALGALSEAPLFVLALGRPEVSELFPGLWAGRGLSHVRLPPLSRKASERLVRHVLGDGAGADVVRDIADRAGGHAFYLEELVRVVAAGAPDALPESVLAMVHARLEALDPEARRVLRAASVFGQSFWPSGVSALVGGGQLAAHLACLCDAELISPRHESRFAGEVEYTFRHALVRETAYGMLTDADRALGHRLAGAWLERAGETDAMRMAEHEERGEVPAAAASWYHRAALQALDGGDPDAALSRAERAIQLLRGDAAAAASGEPDPRAGELHLFRAGVFRIRAASVEQLAAGELAMEHLPAGSAAWCAAVAEVVIAAGKLAQGARAIDLARRLLRAGEADGAEEGAEDAARRAVAAARAAPPLLYMHEIALADALVALARRILPRAAEDPAVAVEITRAEGTRALVTGDIGLYLERVEEVRACYERMGDRRSALMFKGALGYALTQLGEHARSEAVLREVCADAERERIGAAHTLALENLGMTLGYMGRYEEACALEERAIAELERQGDRRMVAGARIYLATVQRLAGRPAEARATAALVLDDPTAPVAFRALCSAVIAQAFLAEGRAAEALVASERAMGILSELGGVLEEGEAGVRLAHAEALAACGQADGARDALRVARERLLLRGARITDARLRDSFLHRVPDHARTLELAAARLDAP